MSQSDILYTDGELLFWRWPTILYVQWHTNLLCIHSHVSCVMKSQTFLWVTVGKHQEVISTRNFWWYAVMYFFFEYYCVLVVYNSSCTAFWMCDALFYWSLKAQVSWSSVPMLYEYPVAWCTLWFIVCSCMYKCIVCVLRLEIHEHT